MKFKEIFEGKNLSYQRDAFYKLAAAMEDINKVLEGLKDVEKGGNFDPKKEEKILKEMQKLWSKSDLAKLA